MVLERLVSAGWLQRRPLYALLLGVIYTFIAAVTAFIFFRQNISISWMFLITLLLVPSLISLLSIEEEREKKAGARHFINNHKDIFEIYWFLSIGVFVGYLIMAWFGGIFGLDPSTTLSEQIRILGTGVTESEILGFTESGLIQALGIFTSNVGVAIIFFCISLFLWCREYFLNCLECQYFFYFYFYYYPKYQSWCKS